MGDYIKQQLGAYNLIKLLGSGGFADVYLGEHIHLGTKAAIKVLHTRLAAQDVDSFRNEARTIAQLAHPNIIRVMDFNIEGETPYLVMDYAPNGTLRHYHPKGTTLPLPTVVFYVKQVASALQYAHNLKIVHRDVKPENILVGRGNEILLTDFGIAIIAQTSNLSRVLDAAGTISYMAPEQIRGQPQPASDQYALGIVTYEWLCGMRPFNGTFTEVAAMQTAINPSPLRNFVQVSPQVEQVVLKALEKEPSRRFPNVEEFARALEAAARESVTKKAAFGGTTTKEPVIKEAVSSGTTIEGAERADRYLPFSPRPSSTSFIRKQKFSRKNILLSSVSLLILSALMIAGVSWGFSHAQNMSTTNSHAQEIATATEKALLAHSGNTGSVVADATPTPTAEALSITNASGDSSVDIYSSKMGKLVYNSSMSRADSIWSVGSNSSYGGDCEYAQGAYQVSQSKPSSIYLCRNSSGDFGDLVFEVQMTVLKGDCGGIFFRYDETKGNDYLFTVCEDGYYGLYTYPSNGVKTLISKYSQVIHAGYNQSNVLALVANGNNIDLYINKQKVDSVSDAALSSGSCGVVAITDGHYTSSTILYRDARIWTS